MDAPSDQQPRATPSASGGDGQGQTGAAATAREPASAPEPVDHNITITRATRVSPEAAQASRDGRGPAAAEDDAGGPVLLPAQTLVGRYIILGHLGSGGMGVVYKAYDPDLNRQIALKLVQVTKARGQDPASLRGRLLREAQGLAKLSHPNVVAVYDVGLFEDGVFLAMELVAGPTLRAWLKTNSSYRDKLQVLIAAGEGLAAAHRAELVHRDFKPDNVILGNDGRPRVLDFGLVRAVGATGEPSSASDLPSSRRPSERADPREPHERSHERGPEVDASGSLGSPGELAGTLGRSIAESSSELSTPLTRVGTVMGTPRYMSPEQFLGLAVDAKSDQFSFCVALYEALYGKPPFRGKELDILRSNVCAGNVRPPPAGVRIPARVRRAVLKGLAAVPDKRHASMAELLTELRRDRRRAGAAIGAGVVAAVATLVVAQQGRATERCQLDLRATRELWSPGARDAIGRAFAASGASHAPDTATRVEALLAARAAAWAAMQRSSCEATWVHGTQSEALLDLRAECLAERRAEQLSLIALYSQPTLEVATVDRAVEASTGLPAISDCADVKALRARRSKPPPGSAPKIAAVRAQLADVRVHALAGDFRTASHDGELVVAAARAIDYPPLVAEAAYEYGMALTGAAQFPAAQVVFEEAMQAAATGGDDHIAALAAAKWLSVVGYDTDRTNEALVSVPTVRTLAARVPNDDVVGSALHNTLGMLRFASGDYAGAQAEFRQALALTLRAGNGQALAAAKLHNNIGAAALLQQKHAEAVVELIKTGDLQRQVLGPDHPHLGRTLTNLGLAQAAMQRHAEAVDNYREGLRIVEAAHGPDHLDVAQVLVSLAESLRVLGELDAAAEAAERSLRLREQQLSPTHAMVGESARMLADVYLTQGATAQALALHRRAVAAYEPAHPNLVEALLGLHRSLTAAGRDREALDALERAEVFARDRGLPSLPSVQAALAKALSRAGSPARARELADAALAAFRGAGQERQREELEAWLAAAR